MTGNMSKKTKPLDVNCGPLVWIDCEMTGLDYQTDTILEIAVLITNGELDIVDDGVEFVIKKDRAVMDNMNEWCIKQHGFSGLTEKCLASPFTLDVVRDSVLHYIKSWIPDQRVGVLAGNSVHADRAFLAREMPELVDWLHYRIVDVSSIKELHRRWYPTKFIPQEQWGEQSSHRALDDIKASIRELKWYKENLFLAPEAAAPMLRRP
ncbi:ribonuclease H-like protein [Stereum hirsutum FP-91666 SS1]|uniref:ribonuclease H-like protein n=1 Tax=Stereum hirsutum (strain FP-91666) TaxID=721885 RepID=UPI0004449341|nr:ribonuclease H-like protein [Stereum hirsutum FP-91666 SS1]EIM85049.1 ribonuclease H-like protein [Stereum hirsutum FP-91666 SS1]